MQTISISLAMSGMVLAREVRSSNNPSERILCGKGVVLTESLISRLRHLGVESVAVEGHPVKVEGDQTAEDILAALDQRFSRVAHDPLMVKIKEIYRRQILRSMGENTGG
jgi:hypothetical protein